MNDTPHSEPTVWGTLSEALSSCMVTMIAGVPQEYVKDLLAVFVNEILLPAMENPRVDGNKSAARYHARVTAGEFDKNETWPQILVAVDFFVQSISAHFFENQNKSWEAAASAKYWAGLAKGSRSTDAALAEKARLLADDLLKNILSRRGKKAANARYNQASGSRSKRAKLLRIWASGRYSTRDACAEQECDALYVTFRTARKWLVGTPDPSPWPARGLHSA